MEINPQFQEAVRIWCSLALKMLYDNNKKLTKEERDIYRTTDEYKHIRFIAESDQLLVLPKYRSVFYGFSHAICMDTYYSMLRRAGVSNMTLNAMEKAVENFWIEAREGAKRRAEQKAKIRRKFNKIGATP